MVPFKIVPDIRKGSEGLAAREGLVSQTAGVAQLVEHLICNQRVGGSNPFASSSIDQAGFGFRNAGHLRGAAA